MKKLVAALIAAFLMTAGLASLAGDPAHATGVVAKKQSPKPPTSGQCKKGSSKYGPCPKPPKPHPRPPKHHAGQKGWWGFPNPRHLGGRVKIVIVGPHGAKRVVWKWTNKKDVSVAFPHLSAGKYRVWVFFWPNGNYRPIYPKYSFKIRS